MSNFNSKYSHIYEDLTHEERLELVEELKYSFEIQKRIDEEQLILKVRNIVRIGDFIQFKKGAHGKQGLSEGQVISMSLEKLVVVSNDGEKSNIKYEKVVL